MSDEEYIKELEAVLAGFLKPVKNIPFSLIIKSMCGRTILPMDVDSAEDSALVAQLARVAALAGELVRANPIRRNRPNEVGNDVESYVVTAATSVGFTAARPKTASGRGRSTGYPDILLVGEDGRPTYLECKIFGEGGDLTTMRSFYLSPSDDFKVTLDARHLLMAFGVEREPIDGSQDSFYRATSFKLVDLSGLKCDVKYEFNSDNIRLYREHLILAEGRV
jgi:hypothetical protein